MGLDTWILNQSFDGRLRVPGPVVQAALDAYLDVYNRLEPIIGEPASVAVQSDEIAPRSRELMDTHYNMPLSMFSSFLGPTLKYSMGLWENGTRTLEEAQEAMMADLCAKAGIQDGHRILDIGCGFGSLAAHVLRHYPKARVYGLTLSRTQADYMRERQGESGHPLNTDRFYLVEDDFNAVSFDQPFDRVVSVGVFEHVSNLARALEKVRQFLHGEGRCFLHYIVYRPRPGTSGRPRQDPFIDRYVFPGGRIWAHPELARHNRYFRLEREWYLSGHHYRRTLRAWLSNFLAHRARIRDTSGLSDRQLRVWEFYLRSCIAVFSVRGGRFYGNGQYDLRPR